MAQSDDEKEDETKQEHQYNESYMEDESAQNDNGVESSANQDSQSQEDGEVLSEDPNTEKDEKVELVNMSQDNAQGYDDEQFEGRIDLGADYDDDDDDDDHSAKHSDKDGGAASAQSYGHNHSRDGSHQQQDDDDENFDLYEDVGGSFSANEDDKEGGFPKEVDLKLKDDDSRRNFRAEVAAPTSDSCKVTVSKLQWWTSDAVLEEFFASCGKVRKITFSEEKANGKSKGSAMIEFSDRCFEQIITPRR